MNIYLTGSLENPKVPAVAAELRRDEHEVFDDWFASGPDADKRWREYEEGRGRSYEIALVGKAATNVFQFDKYNLDWADAIVMMLPAGKSAHMELGYGIGSGKISAILLDDSVPPKWDVMYRFAGVVTSDILLLRHWLLVQGEKRGL